MRYPTQCKFCHKAITVEIDNDYAATGDPYKLLPLAACNHCADLRERHRKVKEDLARFLNNFHQHPKTKEKIEGARKSLTILTKRYVRLVADWTSVPELPWEESIVDVLINDPEEMHSCLGRIWDAAKHTQRLI